MVIVMPFRKAHEVLRRRLGRRVVTSIGHAPTARAARYGRQLCSHLGRKVEARWEADTGEIRFDASSSVTLVAEPHALGLTLTCPEHRRLELQGVLTRHLETFGAKNDLTLTWTTRP